MVSFGREEKKRGAKGKESDNASDEQVGSKNCMEMTMERRWGRSVLLSPLDRLLGNRQRIPNRNSRNRVDRKTTSQQRKSLVKLGSPETWRL